MKTKTMFFIGLGWIILFLSIIFNPVSLSNPNNVITGAAIVETPTSLSQTAIAIIIPLIATNIILLLMLISEHKARKKYQKIF